MANKKRDKRFLMLLSTQLSMLNMDVPERAFLDITSLHISCFDFVPITIIK